MARPSSTVPTWATNVGRRGTLTAGLQATGWVAGQPLDPLLINAIEGPLADWVGWLASDVSPSGQALRATSFSVVDAPGGTVLGYLGSSSGDILLSSDDGVILQASGSLTPTIYLDDAAGTVRLQSSGADGAVLIRAGWALNDQSFRVGFGDTAGDGTGYPTYTWDLSPAFGGWSAYATSGTGLAVVGFDPASSTATADYARIWNYSGATSRLFARSALRQSVLISEDGAVARETAFQLQIRFESDAAGAQPTVSLVAKTSGSATIIATCTCGSSTSAQTITSSPFTHDFDWSANRYFLEWDSVSTVADGQGSRIVSRVSLSNLTRAG